VLAFQLLALTVHAHLNLLAHLIVDQALAQAGLDHGGVELAAQLDPAEEQHQEGGPAEEGNDQEDQGHQPDLHGLPVEVDLPLGGPASPQIAPLVGTQ
jgi:hypothetical protein